MCIFQATDVVKLSWHIDQVKNMVKRYSMMTKLYEKEATQKAKNTIEELVSKHVINCQIRRRLFFKNRVMELITDHMDTCICHHKITGDIWPIYV